MQFKNFAFFAILATLLFSGCSENKSTDESTKNEVKILKERKVFLTTTNNTVISAYEHDKGLKFKELEGKAVLVNFFTTWCPPCKAEIPHLNNLRKKYEGKFEIIGVLLENNKTNEDMQAFIDQFKVQYPITNSKANFELSKVLGEIKSIPTMFMYDKSGNLVQKYVGIVPEEMLESDIKKAIK